MVPAPAGMTSALDLAARGVEVFLVEKGTDIGGRAAEYCCKATDECNRCAACLVLQQKDKVTQEPLIQVYRNASVKAFSKNKDGFKATVASDGKDVDLECQTVIVATGFDPYNLGRRSEFAYGLEKNVVSGIDLEKALKEKGSLTAAFGPGSTRSVSCSASAAATCRSATVIAPGSAACMRPNWPS